RERSRGGERSHVVRPVRRVRLSFLVQERTIMKFAGRILTSASVSLALLSTLSPGSSAQEPPQDRVAALKQWLGQSKAQLKQYQWIQTTVISLKGEQKSSKEEQCYYGVDGTVQKVPLTAPPEEKDKRGLRGRIVENKKEEISDSMKAAVALVKTYVPPSAEKI